ncbi:AraC family transcriptional regulator [Clostridium estertheticum]|uniref:AraC family transcriptional regulator n=1 Tax=Clostridium estertheticum TaxID=238834 RepID=UPI001C0C7153|nr:AraC family transcriptional regulator [Clostridium estertheticum]MBU3176112.1 AraC family transcriptional regulator [Clostridium estertheticum]
MTDVNGVLITKEVAEQLDINPSYLIRLAKELLESGVIKPTEMRSAGKRNYLFNKKAISEIKNKLKK